MNTPTPEQEMHQVIMPTPEQELMDQIILITYSEAASLDIMITQAECFEIAKKIILTNYPKCLVKYLIGEPWSL
jgi:hypothetical protein